jgi:hypothetical protein
VIFDDARAIADAVLFEGYALYPYRPSAPKNHLRFQFGVLAPRAWSKAGSPGSRDAWWLQAQTLLAPRAESGRILGRLRFLQLRRHEGAGWDEGHLREIDFELPFVGAAGARVQIEVGIADGGGGSDAGARDTDWPLGGSIHATAVRVSPGGAHPLWQITVRVENLTAGIAVETARHDALRGAFLGTHLLLAAPGGDFISLTDPPAWATAAAAQCHNVGTYPALAGPPDRRDLVVCAPVILGDHPAIAPESPQDLFDATEIDEILTLRVLTLTDGEKAEMRAAEPRLAALLDRVERLGPEGMARLHGVNRDWRVSAPAGDGSAPAEPPPPTRIRVRGQWVSAGSRVRLQPGARRTDAQDMFLAGLTATVAAVMRDVEDQDCLAVTIDDDPAAELFRWHQRYHYFYPDEVEPVSA